MPWCRVSIPQPGSCRVPCASRQGEGHAPLLPAGSVAVPPGVCHPDTVHQRPDPALQEPHVFGHEEARGGRKRVPCPLRPEWSVPASPDGHGAVRAGVSPAARRVLGASWVLGGRCCLTFFSLLFAANLPSPYALTTRLLVSGLEAELFLSLVASTSKASPLPPLSQTDQEKGQLVLRCTQLAPANGQGGCPNSPHWSMWRCPNPGLRGLGAPPSPPHAGASPSGLTKLRLPL